MGAGDACPQFDLTGVRPRVQRSIESRVVDVDVEQGWQASKRQGRAGLQDRLDSCQSSLDMLPNRQGSIGGDEGTPGEGVAGDDGR